MDTQLRIITADELLLMPNDEFRYELVRGELTRMSPAGQQHGRIVMNIATPLDLHVRANNLGVVYAAETGFKLSSNPDTVRAPDVAFVKLERVKEIGDVQGYWPGAPDLVIEVVSPNDLYTELEEKVFDWLEAGTRMVIIVNPRKHVVTVYYGLNEISILKEGDFIDGKDIVPGWRIAVKDLFL